MFFAGSVNKDLDQFGQMLNRSVERMFLERNEIRFSKDPDMEKRLIIEYGGLMRADGLEKYNESSFISYINYYLNAKDMEKNKAIGAIVVYIEQTYVATLLKLLKYPLADDEDLDALADCCGTLCNIIAGAFKTEISKAGYIELEMSHFTSYRNRAVVGVPFCFNEREKIESTFFIQNQKRLIVETTMGIVPKR
ncbi:MAG TPA: hypothetical protein PLO93_03415 [Candidatus Omnitrophota bacterium]|nr:hypothetical protein [Candidatus Omnitrophota bacterium]HQL41325.1 hypothetical protein [Candidatus Omnitrophota bacterium]